MPMAPSPFRGYWVREKNCPLPTRVSPTRRRDAVSGVRGGGALTVCHGLERSHRLDARSCTCRALGSGAEGVEVVGAECRKRQNNFILPRQRHLTRWSRVPTPMRVAGARYAAAPRRQRTVASVLRPRSDERRMLHPSLPVLPFHHHRAVPPLPALLFPFPTPRILDQSPLRVGSVGRAFGVPASVKPLALSRHLPVIRVCVVVLPRFATLPLPDTLSPARSTTLKTPSAAAVVCNRTMRRSKLCATRCRSTASGRGRRCATIRNSECSSASPKIVTRALLPPQSARRPSPLHSPCYMPPGAGY